MNYNSGIQKLVLKFIMSK